MTGMCMSYYNIHDRCTMWLTLEAIQAGRLGYVFAMQ